MRCRVCKRKRMEVLWMGRAGRQGRGGGAGGHDAKRRLQRPIGQRNRARSALQPNQERALRL